MKLTEKDKKLLYALCILVIVAAFGFFLIKPQLEKHGELEDRLMEAEDQKSAMELVTATAPTSEKAIKESGTAYSQVVADFYPLMNSNQIEQNITELVLDHQLTSVELNVSSQPKLTGLVPYFASGQARKAKEQAEEQDAAAEGTEDTEEDREQTSTVIYSSTVVVTVSGADANMKSLLDTVCADYPAIRITGFERNRKTGIGAGNEVESVSAMKLSMELYMCEK